MKKIVGLCMVAFSLIGIFFCLIKKNEPFFNLRKVITEHLRLFETCREQYFVFYGFPLIFAFGLSMVYQAGAAFYSELSVVLGILLSVLLAMLSILGSYDFSSIQDPEQRSRGIRGIEETTNAILFDSVLIIGLLLYGLTVIVVSGAALPQVLYKIKAVVSGLAYYVFVIVLLNLLLVIKHMSNLIQFNLIVTRGTKNDSSGTKE